MEDNTAMVEATLAALQAEWRALVTGDRRAAGGGPAAAGSGAAGAGAGGAGRAGRHCADDGASGDRASDYALSSLPARWLAPGARPKTLHLTLGDVAVVRQCGYCPACQQTWAPLDQQLRIDQRGRSPRLVETLTLLGAELPFAPAAARLAQWCGVPVGASQVQVVTEGVGCTLVAEQLAAVVAAFPSAHQVPVLPAVERQAPWVLIALAGVLVPHREGHQEVRTGTVVAVRSAQLYQPYRLPWHYAVHPGEVAIFGRLLWLEAYRQGVGQAARVLVLGDGAHWIWNLAEEHFPEAVHIVDLWHAVEHLWAAGRALLGEDEALVQP